MGHKKEHKQQQQQPRRHIQTMQDNTAQRVFPSEDSNFFFGLISIQRSQVFVVDLGKKEKRLEWMCKSGTSWQMFTFQVTLASYTCVNTHLHRSHLLWLATQVVQNNSNNFTHLTIMWLSIIGHYFLLTGNCLWPIQCYKTKGRHRQNVVLTEKKSQ